MPDTRTHEAAALMQDFSERTQAATAQSPQRYLWTDAFAVCNFLGLAQCTGDGRYAERALQLVDRVHHVLGRHREDSRQQGWISGLGEAEAEAHPTRGGLRIGKPLPERRVDEAFDERLEWDRDGQYFHYLTKWMHALDQVARTMHQPLFNRWARELADTAFHAFSYQPADNWGPRRMYWKMSVDLSRPLVAAMGQHDPLDGYITALQLEVTAAAWPDDAGGPPLSEITDGFSTMIRRAEWATADPLGLGGLLSDAWRLAQLVPQGALPMRLPAAELFDTLLDASLTGLQHYDHSGELHLPAEQRLAFRELGLAIGLHAAQRMWRSAGSAAHRPLTGSRVRSQLQALMQYVSLRDAIESFWLTPSHRRAASWQEHRDINQVMLATSLVPDGFLDLRPQQPA